MEKSRGVEKGGGAQSIYLALGFGQHKRRRRVCEKLAFSFLNFFVPCTHKMRTFVAPGNGWAMLKESNDRGRGRGREKCTEENDRIGGSEDRRVQCEKEGHVN